MERLVVAGAVGVFAGGALLGVNLAFSQPESVAEEPACEVREIAPGEVLSSNLVMVDVYNASQRAGLANRVKINLERRGFLGGITQNNPGKLTPRNVAVLTADPQDPRAKLVAAQFKGQVKRIKPDFPMENDIAVLVGRDYGGFKKARTKLRTDSAVTVCVPAITLP